MSEGDTDRCERRGCERQPTHELVTESPILHEKPNRWPLCDDHARVAAEELRGTTNILAARKLAASGRARAHLVADGGTEQYADGTDRELHPLEELRRAVEVDTDESVPDMDEIDWGPARRSLEDGEPCPECEYPFDSDEWDVRHVHGGPSLGEDWIYTCPNCEQETCVIGT